VAGLLLITAMSLLGLGIYLGALWLLSPQTLRETRELGGRLRGGGDPEDAEPVPEPDVDIPDELEILGEREI
jgi:hypothetical protein